jgi:SecD/SecF fusion protein
MNEALQTFLFGIAVIGMLVFYIGTVNSSRKRWVGTVLVLAAVVFSLLTLKYKDGKFEGLKLGIDLQGGSEFIVQLKPGKDKEGKDKPVNSFAIDQAKTILEKRLNALGGKDLSLQPLDVDKIIIQMPGVSASDVEGVRTAIQQVAKLEFRLVHPQSANEIGKDLLVGYTKMPYKNPKEGQPKEVWVTNRSDLDGSYVDGAGASYQAKGWVIMLGFTAEGGKLFGDLTAANVGRQLAVVVDGQVMSDPNLREAIFGGSAEISGDFTAESATALATALENPLENPMVILSESSVSSAYGASSIKQGQTIGVIALLITSLFMFFIYRSAGFVAIIGLIVNLILLFGAMALFGFTVTMPGIAGLVLTIGMAVDANVLIYERLREEMEEGRSFLSALNSAYDKAFSAIADSNITTLISAAILFAISGGLVKGFAVTLVIGIVSSMIGALIVTRVVFMWVVDKGLLKTVNTRRMLPDKIWDMMGSAKPFIIASLVVTAISFATLGVVGTKSLGIDFRGGALVIAEMKAGQNIAGSDIEAHVKTLKLADGKDIGGYYVQEKVAQNGGQVWGIRSEFESGAVIEQAMKAKYGDQITGLRTERVEGQIGGESGKRSLWAMAAALLAIFLYLMLRFEFAFAVGAIVALFHDVLMVPGLCVLFGQELSLIHVGALLTIAGYSINDTIVVFDRIRETIHAGKKGSMRELMNEALSKTLSRTLLTGPTALAPMIILMFIGNPAMTEFAMPLVIGVLLGTYSSIFIASPLVLWYATRTGTQLEEQIREAAEHKKRLDAQVKSAQAQEGA